MSGQNGKTAIVTGASGGIGAAVAERLARDGFAVIVHCAGNAAAAEALERRIEAAEAAFGGADVLVNAAGIMDLATVAESGEALFDRTVATNLKGTLITLREAARRLRDGGRIVNFSSSVTALLQPTYGVYAATKAAVEAMTAVLAKEMRGRGVTVNAVAPGPTATKLFLDGKPQELVERLSKAAPLERLGQPGDIAAAVAFLVGPDGAWINGQTLRANGGLIRSRGPRRRIPHPTISLPL